MPELFDPLLDDLTPMRSYLRPSTFEPAPPRVLPEPPDGSVRRGDDWETTSTSDWQPITEVMKWPGPSPLRARGVGRRQAAGH